MKKTIVVGVTGGIAAYKSATLVSSLKKKGYDVYVIMTKNATQFISPLTFETLSNNKVSLDTFDRYFEYDVKHISLAKKADVFVVAPATANFIAKVANGIADDMLTTTFLAANCKKILCPAMNTGMLENPITQNNIHICKKYSMHILESASGYLACGDVGKGRMTEPEEIVDYIEMVIGEKPLQGKKVMITAGPTQESIDPVRYITNHSSGKMGYALARQARNMGADVTLVSGPVGLKEIPFIRTIHVESAHQMSEAVKNECKNQDVIIMAAAVADFTVLDVAKEKIKKDGNSMELSLSSTEDILAYLGKVKQDTQIVIGFAMETQNLIENAKKKLEKKNCDYIIANSIAEKGAGFQVDTNKVTILSKESTIPCEVMPKEELAQVILKMCVLKEK